MTWSRIATVRKMKLCQFAQNLKICKTDPEVDVTSSQDAVRVVPGVPMDTILTIVVMEEFAVVMLQVVHVQ